MNKVKIREFEVGAILSVITGFSCVDDFSKVYDLICFVCDNNLISPIALGTVKDDVKNHLLTLYPKLNNISIKKYGNTCKLSMKEQINFHSMLPVTQLGVKLPKQEDKNKVK